MNATHKHLSKVARDVIAFLRGLGVERIDVSESKRCHRLSWTMNKREFAIPVSRSSHGSNAFQTVVKEIRRLLRAAGFVAPLAGAAT